MKTCSPVKRRETAPGTRRAGMRLCITQVSTNQLLWQWKTFGKALSVFVTLTSTHYAFPAVPLIQHMESRIMIPLKASPLQWGVWKIQLHPWECYSHAAECGRHGFHLLSLLLNVLFPSPFSSRCHLDIAKTFICGFNSFLKGSELCAFHVLEQDEYFWPN